MTEEVADDAFGLEFFGLPEFAEFLPGRFAGGEFFFAFAQGDFAELEEVVAFLDPIGHEFAFAEELFALLLEAFAELIDFAALEEEGFLAVVVELGDFASGVVDAFACPGFAEGLGELGGRFLDGDAHFEQLAVGGFEFEAEFVESLVAGIEIFRMGGEHLVLALQFGLTEFVIADERAFLEFESSLDFGAVIDEGGASFVERIPGAIEAAFSFLEEFAEVEHLGTAEFELPAIPFVAIEESLLRNEEFALLFLHFAAHFVEVFELEADAIFEELAFLTEFVIESFVRGLEITVFVEESLPFDLDPGFDFESAGLPFGFLAFANGGEVGIDALFGEGDAFGPGFGFGADLEEFDALFLDFVFDPSAATFALGHFDFTAFEFGLLFLKLLLGLGDPEAYGALFLIQLGELGEESLFALFEFLLLVGEVFPDLIDLGEEAILDEVIRRGNGGAELLGEEIGARGSGGVEALGSFPGVAQVMGGIDAEDAPLFNLRLIVGGIDVVVGFARREGGRRTIEFFASIAAGESRVLHGGNPFPGRLFE